MLLAIPGSKTTRRSGNRWSDCKGVARIILYSKASLRSYASCCSTSVFLVVDIILCKARHTYPFRYRVIFLLICLHCSSACILRGLNDEFHILYLAYSTIDLYRGVEHRCLLCREEAHLQDASCMTRTLQK